MSESIIQIDHDLAISKCKTAVVAEIGINHNGNVDLAKKMIVSAWENGANLVKLQSFKVKSFLSNDLPYIDSVKSLELGFDVQKDLFLFAKENGIRLFTTPFDIDTLNFLDEFDLPAYKIASMDCNNYQLIEAVSKRQKPVIISTGMATINEIREAVRTVKNTGNKNVILLHCVSDYPTADKDFNLKYMQTLNKKFNILSGVSDHTVGMDAAYLSVGAGASVIEKHFTIGKSKSDKYAGPDHQVSMTPDKLKKLSGFCKVSEIIMGDGIRSLTENEKNSRQVFRRGLYVSSDILKGETITGGKIIAKRPVRGIPVSEFKDILGKTAKKELKRGSFITYDCLEN